MSLLAHGPHLLERSAAAHGGTTSLATEASVHEIATVICRARIMSDSVSTPDAFLDHRHVLQCIDGLLLGMMLFSINSLFRRFYPPICIVRKCQSVIVTPQGSGSNKIATAMHFAWCEYVKPLTPCLTRGLRCTKWFTCGTQMHEHIASPSVFRQGEQPRNSYYILALPCLYLTRFFANRN
jgi:hypothetical protein